MRIYSMTATFGKLEHETLTLKPGLNVICAPNEWGKSTWCSFLLAMLYGLDTRSKTTRGTLAEKERYAPWSGSPMAGRIDLNWNGRDITIERSTKGRIPLGQFRAYETATGLEVPELNAYNCGQQLLGVEQSVYRRAGFIRLKDLPVTQDEALRARLNALVTTGDESGDAVRLQQNLRDLRNRCRYNRTGLLPQAMEEREALERKLGERSDLDAQMAALEQRREENNALLRQLENHKRALAYREAQADDRRVADAREARDRELQRLEIMEADCAGLPARETVEDKCRLLRSLNQECNCLQIKLRELPPDPGLPEVLPAFRGLTPEEALRQADADAAAFGSVSGRGWLVLMLMGMLCVVTAGALACLSLFFPAVLDLVVGIGSFLTGYFRKSDLSQLENQFLDKYGTLESIRWNSMAAAYGQVIKRYERECGRFRAARQELESRLTELDRQRTALCDGQPPEQTQEAWQQILNWWDRLADARKDATAAGSHLETLMAMAKRAEPPAFADTLAEDPQETEDKISDTREQQQRLFTRMEQCRSRMEALGTYEALSAQLDAVKQRIKKLDDTYAALTIALDTLAAATAELQRRFAPPITVKAQEIFSAMTDGRYDRLMIADDFSLRAGAQREDTLHDALWRSDGTIDQMYLSLRLAVSGELTPEAPLVLDDALVRFDDHRREAALAILQQLGQEKQIILFTCQQMEKNWLDAHEKIAAST